MNDAPGSMEGTVLALGDCFSTPTQPPTEKVIASKFQKEGCSHQELNWRSKIYLIFLDVHQKVGGRSLVEFTLRSH